MRALIFTALLACAAGCAARLSNHPVTPANLGAPVTRAQMLSALQGAGVGDVEKVIVADWRWSEDFATPGIEPPDWRSQPLDGQVYMYVLRHPAHGLYLIDAGLPADAARHLGLVVRRAFAIDETFRLRQSTADSLSGETPRGVFLTHLHWDHVLGLRDLPHEMPIFVGPQDGDQRHFLLRFIAPATRRALAGRPALQEWRFAPAPDGLSIVDVFGDGWLFAIHAPGHTPGSTAYVVNAASGAHLMTGDAIHTAAGWRGDRVEYITFDPDRPRAWRTLAALQDIAAAIPGITVHPGHQQLAPPPR